MERYIFYILYPLFQVYIKWDNPSTTFQCNTFRRFLFCTIVDTFALKIQRKIKRYRKLDNPDTLATGNIGLTRISSKTKKSQKRSTPQKTKKISKTDLTKNRS